MDGVGGKPGWAWIFILEGLFTILLACASPWVIQDFPESAKFLSEAERMCSTTPAFCMIFHADIYVGVCIIRELKEDMRFSADEERFKLKYMWQCLTDWKTYVAREFSLPTKISYRGDIIHSWNMCGIVSAVP
jgi:hypothetical protein